ncbi:MAG: ATP-grasp domain-containing protein [Thomasclavelia sp.]|uniref:ATP-grasp domain-containing protein n=1 Tax=Thomasclavelia sp. TaxID=3025757 RepID=UPI0039A11582
MINILILSCGTRNKIIQYFKSNLSDIGKVIATDCNPLAPALYEADKYYIVPKMVDIGYLGVVLDICKKENVTAVLSLIDPELSLLAKNSEKFKKIGVTVIGSNYEACELALDKWKMYNWLKNHGYNCAKSYLDINDFYKDLDTGRINFPVFVKPYKGSASMAISKVDDKETLDILIKNNQDLLIQEYLDGQELGVDCYIDIITKKVVSIFAKKKLVMRAGETDKAVSFIDKKLFDLISKFVKEANFLAQIDIDVFNVNGKYYISEVNPRFGGGYPHAYECGVNHMKLIINNLQGRENRNIIGKYEEKIYMMKYSEIMMKKAD